MKKISKMIVVLDTSVLLVSFPSHSPYRLIFDALVAGGFTLALSNEILAEYEEKITERYDGQTVKELFGLLSILPNVMRVTPYFRWRLVANDPDDDKFVDVAISANADYIVTNDRHFGILKTVAFPKVTTCTAQDFRTILHDKQER